MDMSEMMEVQPEIILGGDTERKQVKYPLFNIPQPPVKLLSGSVGIFERGSFSLQGEFFNSFFDARH